jgi:hypothetical protein
LIPCPPTQPLEATRPGTRLRLHSARTPPRPQKKDRPAPCPYQAWIYVLQLNNRNFTGRRNFLPLNRLGVAAE